MNRILISDLATWLNKQPIERQLPNGAKVRQIVWEGRDAEEVWKVVSHMSINAEEVLIDGPAPAWLVAVVSHAVHPFPVSLADPKVEGGKMPIYRPRPLGAGSGPVSFRVEERENASIVEFSLAGPVFDPDDLKNVVPPEVRPGKPVIISGRGPNYLTVSLIESYAHIAPAVAAYQPPSLYTCCVTHSPLYRLGDQIHPAEKVAGASDLSM